MCTNFDEMDIEPKSEQTIVRKTKPEDFTKHDNKMDDEELQKQLLLRKVPLDDGCIGHVFTCIRFGPLATWRCHVCNFIDTWQKLLKHIDSKRHEDNMSMGLHPRSNFSKVENAFSDINRGQPLPPGMEDVIAGSCQILKTLESFGQPLIGLEFLLELDILDFREPRYLCLLCDKRGDPRSILVHLTSQSHYRLYLRRYFPKFYSLIDKLPKSNECRGNVSMVTSHLIAKLEEKYGRLQPTVTRENIINSPEQRTILLQKVENSVHFRESAEDSYLEEMLTIEYVQNTPMLLKNFQLKPKVSNIVEKINEPQGPKSLFKTSKLLGNKKQLRSRDSNLDREDSPDVVFVGTLKPSQKRESRRHSREYSPSFRSAFRSRRRSNSPDRKRRMHGSSSQHRDPYYRSMRSRSRSPHSYKHHRSRSPYDNKHPYRSPSPNKNLYSKPSPQAYRYKSPERYRGRSPFPDRGRSPFPDRGRSPYLDHGRSPFTDRGRLPLSDRGRSPLSDRGRSPLPDVYGSRHRGRSRNRSPRHGRGHTPHRSRSGARASETRSYVSNSLKSTNHRSMMEEEDKTSYLSELKNIEEKLAQDLVKYLEIPEQHPLYQDEWKKFWCAKFKEIQTEGKVDPHTYDYKPEWIKFWTVRVHEIHEKELRRRKQMLKSKYGISEGEDITLKANEIENSKSTLLADEHPKPVIDIKTMWKELTGIEIHEDRAKRKSLSPWENDVDKLSEGVDARAQHENTENGKSDMNENIKQSLSSILQDSAQPISPEPLSSISDTESLGNESPPNHTLPQKSRSRSISRSRSRSGSRSYTREQPMLKEEYPFRKPSKKIQIDNPLNIITVLRQLSVLEFQLGSYASHVISLLSSGLAMERMKPQSSVDLMTKENVIFLELVKEKLKGQLLACVVPKALVKATLFCIKNIDQLLLLAPKMKAVEPLPIPTPPPEILYGAGVRPMEATSPATLPYGSHVYAHQPKNKGGMKSQVRKKDKKQDRYPFRKSPIKKSENVKEHLPSEKYPSKPQPFEDAGMRTLPTTSAPSANVFMAQQQPQPSMQNEKVDLVIDEKLIALEIAEVLTAQGRTDVSEGELQALINTVVENLKEEQRRKMSTAHKTSAEPVQSIPMAVAAVLEGGSSNNDFPIIPAGFDLNDVSSSTLAMLQDAYENVSLSKTLDIASLSEIELIKMLRDFKNIHRLNQEKLIEYLRKLEDTDPLRVEELKKYVDIS